MSEVVVDRRWTAQDRTGAIALETDIGLDQQLRGLCVFCTLIDHLVANWYRLAVVILLRPFEPGASFKPSLNQETC
jgi:hypothetical protein